MAAADYEAPVTGEDVDDAVMTVKGAGTGILVKTGVGAGQFRVLDAGSAKIAITNGDGIAGNPAVDLGAVAVADLSDGAAVQAKPAEGAFVDGDKTLLDSVPAALAAKAPVMSRKTLSEGYSVVSGDAGNVLDCVSATDINITLPASVSLFPPTTIQAWGDGAVIVTAAAGVSLNGTVAGTVTVNPGEAAYIMTHPSTADDHRAVGALA